MCHFALHVLVFFSWHNACYCWVYLYYHHLVIPIYQGAAELSFKTVVQYSSITVCQYWLNIIICKYLHFKVKLFNSLWCFWWQYSWRMIIYFYINTKFIKACIFHSNSDFHFKGHAVPDYDYIRMKVAEKVLDSTVMCLINTSLCCIYIPNIIFSRKRKKKQSKT